MRNPTIDLLKAFASQIIVLHHLVLYTPMAQDLSLAMPGLMGMLGDEARYVVQIFLVAGGFLAAQSLFKLLEQTQPSLNSTRVGQMIWRRYLRLAKPFWVAILAVLVLAWLARHIAVHPEIPQSPSAFQLAAHVLLLHDIVGVEALSAGVWYVAIDFQLFVLVLLLAWGSQRVAPWLACSARSIFVTLAGLMACASLLWWNTKVNLDEWAWYFMGSYGLGILAQWARIKRRRLTMLVFIACLMGLALLLNMRERLLLTTLTALLLMYSDTLFAVANRLSGQVVRWLADISYSVFLIHYAVAVFTSSVVLALNVQGLAFSAAAFMLTWVLSIVAGHVLHRWVELR